MLIHSKVNILCGNFGSGKTEISLNLCIKKAKENCKVTLVDLDIVNPFFRSREKQHLLDKYGIKIISSSIKHPHADLPALSPAIISPLQHENDYVFFDVGGDEIGANVLGRYRNFFKHLHYSFFFVINCRRPRTSKAEDIQKLIEHIEAKSGLKITGLINNTNLGTETKIMDILDGYDIIAEVSKNTNIPISFHTVKENLSEKKELYKVLKEPVFPIKLLMRYPWEE